MFKPLLLFAYLTLLFSPQAHSLQPFSATFKVEALGIHIGYAEHQLRCQDTLCELTSNATPIGLARRLIGEQSHETSTLELNQHHLSWLSYDAIIKKMRNQSIKEQFNLQLDKESHHIINVQRNQTWEYTHDTFDTLSMAYALQHRLIHQQPINNMILQEEKQQRPLSFIPQTLGTLNTPFQARLITRHFIADAADYRVSVWLAPELNFFPVQVEIYDKKRRRGLMLSLNERPDYTKEK
ncbi:DUF3108 domain-containing protein [Thiomicrospira microaerophila]|uniref:DUF3108 domain-containing protein n=1 Tax=Thiomicrospira microaerophila TaxID=406020 RepID=UPI0005CAEC6C|nr:DUF3108 domain-containing protein [Thiomicrospira microaerophila]